jgi:hypothetical protein
MAAPESRWVRLGRHAVFPLLVYLVLSQALRENYPFSHYPMYSQPSSRPLKFQYLADGSGKPLPVSWHTGVTPSQVGKLHGTRNKKHDDDAAAAAMDVLAFLRTQNAKRKGRELPARIQLIETSIGFDHGGFAESNRVLAENQAP